MALFDYVRQLAAISLVGLASLAAPQASASSYPNFVLDLNQSKIAVDSTTACTPNCALNGSFTSSGEKSVAFGSEGQTVSLNHLIKWTMQPGALAAGIYNISVKLVFTSPELAETSGGGKGVFWTFFGILSGGVIDWTNPFQDVAFAQGSELGVKMDKVNFGFSNSSYSNSSYSNSSSNSCKTNSCKTNSCKTNNSKHLNYSRVTQDLFRLKDNLSIWMVLEVFKRSHLIQSHLHL